MDITSFISKKAICADLKSDNKLDAIKEIINLLVDSGSIEKKKAKKINEVIVAREELGSTGIGQGIAIPHGKCDAAKELVGTICISKKGIDFDSLDGSPVYIIFFLIAPIDSAGPHLKALAKISRILKDKFIRESLKLAKDETVIYKIIEQEDARISSS